MVLTLVVCIIVHRYTDNIMDEFERIDEGINISLATHD